MNTFSLPVKITHSEAELVLKRFKESLKALTAPELKTFVVDASDLKEFNSSALALLLAFKRQLQSKGLSMEVTHLPAQLHNLAKVYGVDMFLKLA
ncbi:MAG: STAS domain-containing protein [Betaproteobacteria bacterium]